MRQPWSGFHRNHQRADGRAIWCKACVGTYAREHNQRPDVKKRAAEAALARYHTLTKDEKLQIQRRRYDQARNLERKYGLTLANYEAMLETQGGGCAICGRRPEARRRLSVDHDHACCPGEKSCGKCVRGLLCITCNVWLGFYENEDWMTRARAYLDRAITEREGEL